MKDMLNLPTVFIEIGFAAIRVLSGERGLEIPLERALDGKLTTSSREKIIAGLEKFLERKSWQPRLRALCGLSAQGLSLRQINLPVTTPDDFERVLRLQIESELPLSPEEMAWGWRDISANANRREILVVAVRKQIVEDYAALLTAAGLNPEFAVSAFARQALCKTTEAAQAVLEITPSQSELVVFENGVPVTARVFASGAGLAEVVKKNSTAKQIFISGPTADTAEFLAKLSGDCKCQRLEVPSGDGFSAATLGLKKIALENLPLLLLQVRAQAKKNTFNLTLPENRYHLKWAVALLALLLLFPFAEALLVKPFLNWRLNSFKAEQEKFLSVVAPEAKFLLYLKENQPPYLDALYIFAKSTPPGGHLDSLSLDQRGQISLKAAMPNGQAVTDFRAKIMASGFFANISVEEQTPVQNQPRVNVRMSAQWKPAGLRATVSVPAPVVETNKLGLMPGTPKNLKL